MKYSTILTFYLLSSSLILAQRNANFQYDDLNRLNKIIYFNGLVIQYTYDQLGNRLTKARTFLLPVQAGTITGQAGVCQGADSIAYSVPVITNAAWYIWSLPVGAVIIAGDSTRNILVYFTAPAQSGNISVYGKNEGGSGTISPLFPVTVNPLPVAAGSISGPDSVQQGQNNLSYSVAAIPNATSYLWSYSGTGATISGNSNNITISFASNATSGILHVNGTNLCGEGPSSFDFPVTVLTGVLANQDLQNLTITPGQVSCYNATQTIAVAGNGTSFKVESGGSATLIAGQNIVFLPNVQVDPGGYLHGYITTTSEYCFSALKPVALVETKQVTEEKVEKENWLEKVYPNPTSGMLTLALKTSDQDIPFQIRMYNLFGEMVYSKELIGKNTDVISLTDLRPGMYFLHVMLGGSSEVVKVIRN
jgi:hypothetical protein